MNQPQYVNVQSVMAVLEQKGVEIYKLGKPASITMRENVEKGLSERNITITGRASLEDLATNLFEIAGGREPGTKRTREQEAVYGFASNIDTYVGTGNGPAFDVGPRES